MKKMLKGVAAVTLFCFLTTQCVSAAPGVGIEMIGQRELPAYLSIDVPPELGTVDALYEAPSSANPQFILHIQNAHANYQAQMKIKQLLGYMNKKYGFKTIFVEGASEKLDADYLRLFPDQERNLKLCDELAKQGELTGAELFLMEEGGRSTEYGDEKGARSTEYGENTATGSAVRDTPYASRRTNDAVEALGIEQAALYKANYDALKKVFGAETDVTRFFKGFDGKLDKVASQTFTPETRELIADWKRFEQGRRDFMPFVKGLTVKSKKILNVDLESLFAQVGWPQITRLLVIQQMEKDMNKAKGQEEQAALIKWLRTKGVSKELLATLENFTEGSIAVGKSTKEVSPREILENLAQEAGPKGFKFSDYPAFSLYAGYVTLRSELDSKVLFEEIEYLFTQMLDTLAKEPEQKTLLALYRDGELLRKLLHLELNRTQWRQVLEHRDQVAIPSLVSRLKEAVYGVRSTEYGENAATSSVVRRTPSAVQAEATSDVMPKAFSAKMDELFTAGLEFYDFAHQREAVFYKEMQSQMQEKKITKAILITGGFHTDGMSDLFRENAISYGIVTPRLSEKSDENLYRTVMLQNQEHPFSISYLEKSPLLMSLRAQQLQGVDVSDQIMTIVGSMMALNMSLAEAVEALNATPLVKETGGFFKFAGNENGKASYQWIPLKEVQEAGVPDITLTEELGAGLKVTGGAITPAMLKAIQARVTTDAGNITPNLPTVPGNAAPIQAVNLAPASAARSASTEQGRSEAMEFSELEKQNVVWAAAVVAGGYFLNPDQIPAKSSLLATMVVDSKRPKMVALVEQLKRDATAYKQYSGGIEQSSIIRTLNEFLARSEARGKMPISPKEIRGLIRELEESESRDVSEGWPGVSRENIQKTILNLQGAENFSPVRLIEVVSMANRYLGRTDRARELRKQAERMQAESGSEARVDLTANYATKSDADFERSRMGILAGELFQVSSDMDGRSGRTKAVHWSEMTLGDQNRAIAEVRRQLKAEFDYDYTKRMNQFSGSRDKTARARLSTQIGIIEADFQAGLTRSNLAVLDKLFKQFGIAKLKRLGIQNVVIADYKGPREGYVDREPMTLDQLNFAQIAEALKPSSRSKGSDTARFGRSEARVTPLSSFDVEFDHDYAAGRVNEENWYRDRSAEKLAKFAKSLKAVESGRKYDDKRDVTTVTFNVESSATGKTVATGQFQVEFDHDYAAGRVNEENWYRDRSAEKLAEFAKSLRAVEAGRKYDDKRDVTTVTFNVVARAEARNDLVKVRKFYTDKRAKHPIAPILSEVIQMLDQKEYRKAWERLEAAETLAIEDYNTFGLGMMGRVPSQEEALEMVMSGKADELQAQLNVAEAPLKDYFEPVKMLQTVRQSIAESLAEQGVDLLGQKDEAAVLTEALDIVRRYGGEPDRYDPYNIADLTRMIRGEYEGAGHALTPVVMAHIGRVMNQLDVVGRKPQLKQGISVTPEMIAEAGAPKTEEDRIIYAARSDIAAALRMAPSQFGDFLIERNVGKDGKAKQGVLKDIEDPNVIREVSRLALAGNKFNGAAGAENVRGELADRLRSLFTPGTVDLMLAQVSVQDDGSIFMAPGAVRAAMQAGQNEVEDMLRSEARVVDSIWGKKPEENKEFLNRVRGDLAGARVFNFATGEDVTVDQIDALIGKRADLNFAMMRNEADETVLYIVPNDLVKKEMLAFPTDVSRDVSESEAIKQAEVWVNRHVTRNPWIQAVKGYRYEALVRRAKIRFMYSQKVNAAIRDFEAANKDITNGFMPEHLDVIYLALEILTRAGLSDVDSRLQVAISTLVEGVYEKFIASNQVNGVTIAAVSNLVSNVHNKYTDAQRYVDPDHKTQVKESFVLYDQKMHDAVLLALEAELKTEASREGMRHAKSAKEGLLTMEGFLNPAKKWQLKLEHFTSDEAKRILIRAGVKDGQTINVLNNDYEALADLRVIGEKWSSEKRRAFLAALQATALKEVLTVLNNTKLVGELVSALEKEGVSPGELPLRAYEVMVTIASAHRALEALQHINLVWRLGTSWDGLAELPFDETGLGIDIIMLDGSVFLSVMDSFLKNEGKISYAQVPAIGESLKKLKPHWARLQTLFGKEGKEAIKTALKERLAVSRAEAREGNKLLKSLASLAGALMVGSTAIGDTLVDISIHMDYDPATSNRPARMILTPTVRNLTPGFVYLAANWVSSTNLLSGWSAEGSAVRKLLAPSSTNAQSYRIFSMTNPAAFYSIDAFQVTPTNAPAALSATETALTGAAAPAAETAAVPAENPMAAATLSAAVQGVRDGLAQATTNGNPSSLNVSLSPDKKVLILNATKGTFQEVVAENVVAIATDELGNLLLKHRWEKSGETQLLMIPKDAYFLPGMTLEQFLENYKISEAKVPANVRRSFAKIAREAAVNAKMLKLLQEQTKPSEARSEAREDLTPEKLRRINEKGSYEKFMERNTPGVLIRAYEIVVPEDSVGMTNPPEITVRVMYDSTAPQVWNNAQSWLNAVVSEMNKYSYVAVAGEKQNYREADGRFVYEQKMVRARSEARSTALRAGEARVLAPKEKEELGRASALLAKYLVGSEPLTDEEKKALPGANETIRRINGISAGRILADLGNITPPDFSKSDFFKTAKLGDESLKPVFDNTQFVPKLPSSDFEKYSMQLPPLDFGKFNILNVFKIPPAQNTLVNWFKGFGVLTVVWWIGTAVAAVVMAFAGAPVTLTSAAYFGAGFAFVTIGLAVAKGIAVLKERREREREAVLARDRALTKVLADRMLEPIFEKASSLNVWSLREGISPEIVEAGLGNLLAMARSPKAPVLTASVDGVDKLTGAEQMVQVGIQVRKLLEVPNGRAIDKTDVSKLDGLLDAWRMLTVRPVTEKETAKRAEARTLADEVNQSLDELGVEGPSYRFRGGTRGPGGPAAGISDAEKAIVARELRNGMAELQKELGAMRAEFEKNGTLTQRSVELNYKTQLWTKLMQDKLNVQSQTSSKEMLRIALKFFHPDLAQGNMQRDYVWSEDIDKRMASVVARRVITIHKQLSGQPTAQAAPAQEPAPQSSFKDIMSYAAIDRKIDTLPPKSARPGIGFNMGGTAANPLLLIVTDFGTREASNVVNFTIHEGNVYLVHREESEQMRLKYIKMTRLNEITTVPADQLPVSVQKEFGMSSSGYREAVAEDLIMLKLNGIVLRSENVPDRIRTAARDLGVSIEARRKKGLESPTSFKIAAVIIRMAEAYMMKARIEQALQGKPASDTWKLVELSMNAMSEDMNAGVVLNADSIEAFSATGDAIAATLGSMVAKVEKILVAMHGNSLEVVFSSETKRWNIRVRSEARLQPAFARQARMPEIVGMAKELELENQKLREARYEKNVRLWSKSVSFSVPVLSAAAAMVAGVVPTVALAVGLLAGSLAVGYAFYNILIILVLSPQRMAFFTAPEENVRFGTPLVTRIEDLRQKIVENFTLLEADDINPVAEKNILSDLKLSIAALEKLEFKAVQSYVMQPGEAQWKDFGDKLKAIKNRSEARELTTIEQAKADKDFALMVFDRILEVDKEITRLEGLRQTAENQAKIEALQAERDTLVPSQARKTEPSDLLMDLVRFDAEINDQVRQLGVLESQRQEMGARLTALDSRSAPKSEDQIKKDQRERKNAEKRVASLIKQIETSQTALENVRSLRQTRLDELMANLDRLDTGALVAFVSANRHALPTAEELMAFNPELMAKIRDAIERQGLSTTPSTTGAAVIRSESRAGQKVAGKMRASFRDGNLVIEGGVEGFRASLKDEAVAQKLADFLQARAPSESDIKFEALRGMVVTNFATYIGESKVPHFVTDLSWLNTILPKLSSRSESRAELEPLQNITRGQVAQAVFVAKEPAVAPVAADATRKIAGELSPRWGEIPPANLKGASRPVLEQGVYADKGRLNVEQYQVLAKEVWNVLPEDVRTKLINRQLKYDDKSLAGVLAQIVVPSVLEISTPQELKEAVAVKIAKMLTTLVAIKKGEFDRDLFARLAKEILTNPVMAVSEADGATVIVLNDVPTDDELSDLTAQLERNTGQVVRYVIANGARSGSATVEALKLKIKLISETRDFRDLPIGAGNFPRIDAVFTAPGKAASVANSIVSSLARNDQFRGGARIAILVPENVQGSFDEMLGTVVESRRDNKAYAAVRNLVAMKVSQLLNKPNDVEAVNLLKKQIGDAIQVTEKQIWIDGDRLGALETLRSELRAIQAVSVAA